MFAQGTQTSSILGNKLNTITTAVPFLMVAPDSRAGAMGDAGVSSTPDANSQHWNPAKFAFIDKDMGFSVSYSPWLKALVNDINLAYVTGYKRIDEMSTVSASLLYFSLGDITFTNDIGVETGNYRPNEFSIDAAYSRKFTDNFSMAVSGRYIYSNLTQGQYVSGQETHAGQSVATDVAFYYQKTVKMRNRQKAIYAFGVNVSNIGAKISYTSSTEKDFIPTNLRLGPSLTMDLDDYNRISFMLDFNKLLVPSPPIYKLNDTTGLPVRDPNGDLIIAKGKDPNVGIVKGMLQSFGDAPGGTDEELREINYSVGVEYWYDKQFAVRGGYFHENKYKGNRKFFTLGAGLKYNVFGLDFAYLIPVEQRNPLENTIRFSLLFDMDAFNKQNEK
ncbi:MAG: type IX secretion system outer membrane channel protein PorV [Bacteroidetes bacterium]|nr:type IX secretion system outer membrane channel protein PorV [Bacteroidota bacterium]